MRSDDRLGLRLRRTTRLEPARSVVPTIRWISARAAPNASRSRLDHGRQQAEQDESAEAVGQSARGSAGGSETPGPRPSPCSPGWLVREDDEDRPVRREIRCRSRRWESRDRRAGPHRRSDPPSANPWRPIPDRRPRPVSRASVSTRDVDPDRRIRSEARATARLSWVPTPRPTCARGRAFVDPEGTDRDRPSSAESSTTVDGNFQGAVGQRAVACPARRGSTASSMPGSSIIRPTPPNWRGVVGPQASRPKWSRLGVRMRKSGHDRDAPVSEPRWRATDSNMFGRGGRTPPTRRAARLLDDEAMFLQLAKRSPSRGEKSDSRSPGSPPRPPRAWPG